MGAARAAKALRVGDLYDRDGEERRLLFILDALYRRILTETHLLVTAALDLDPDEFRLPDGATEALLREAATRVVLISEATRAAIAERLAAGQAAGDSTAALVARLSGLYEETWPHRSETIVRTEIGAALLLAALDRYRATGLVDRVKLRDGDGDEPCASRNGTTVAIEDAPGLAHPNCLVGGQGVFAPNVRAAATRWFDGEVVVIRTAANDLLAATPNHPILTDKGWVAAQLITQGDNVLRCTDGQRVARMLDPDHHHMPLLIEQVADSLRPARGGATATVPGTAEDFHGDGGEGDVNIVWADRLAGESTVRQHRQQVPLARALVGARALLAESAPREVFGGAPATPHGIMGGGRDRPAKFGRSGGVQQLRRGLAIANRPAAISPRLVQVGRLETAFFSQGRAHLPDEIAVVERAVQRVIAQALGLTRGTNRPPEAMEGQAQRLGGHATIARDLRERFPGLVALTRVSEVVRRPFRGHVYNLQTEQGWYVAENMVTHNCVLLLLPVLRDGAV